MKKVADNYEGVLLMVCFVSGVPPKRMVAVYGSDWGVVMVFKLWKVAVSIR